MCDFLDLFQERRSYGCSLHLVFHSEKGQGRVVA